MNSRDGVPLDSGTDVHGENPDNEPTVEVMNKCCFPGSSQRILTVICDLRHFRIQQKIDEQ